MRFLTTTLGVLAIVALAAGCGETTTDGGSGGGGETPTGALPAGLFTDAAPGGAVDVFQAKESAKEGDEVVVRGRIGGAHAPFVQGRAVMTIASTGKMTSCDDRPGDACQAPWDFCCETPEDIIANTATVQVVGDDGKPLKVGLQGQNGLEPLTVVTVKGTAGPRPTPGVLVVNAASIHVER